MGNPMRNLPGSHATPSPFAMKPANVLDVAAYILEQRGPMTAMKLQKLVYYCQAWSLVWDERPMFQEDIEAWANGPVVRELYAEHRGCFDVAKGTFSSGNSSKLPKKAVATIQAVLGFYGEKDAHWLSQLTHRETPWRNAREGLEPGDRGSSVISPAAMAEYYGSLAK